MATFTRVKVKKQSCGRMLGALTYVLQDKKVRFEGGKRRQLHALYQLPRNDGDEATVQENR